MRSLAAVHFSSKKFRRFLLLAVVLVLGSGAFAQGLPEGNPVSETKRSVTKHGETIAWRSDYRLRFSDFKAPSRRRSGKADIVAVTTTSFGYRVQNAGGKITGSVYVHFYCDESWWDGRVYDESVLAHEQLHFDICELFGRKMYRELLLLRQQQNLSERTLKRLQARLEKQYNDYQSRYDRETEHSIRSEAQQKWNHKIKSELAELEAFADYRNF